MRSISTRFLIPFALLALAISIFVFHQTYEASRKHANELISRQAAIALEFNLAIRDYAAEKIRPSVENLAGADVFVPETMSTSFISRSIFEQVRRKFPDFIIRFASDNPRNPVNLANPDEMRMIEYFRRNPGVNRRTETMTIDGRQFLAHFTPKRMKQECIRCHGDSGDAPAQLVKMYGPTASFHRKLDDVAGLDMIAVPLDAINAPLTSELRSQMIILASGLALLFGSILFTFRFVVTRRLEAMTRHFIEIASQAKSPAMTPVPVRGKDEISEMGRAFNKLVEHLRTTHAELELRVDLRTEELRKANEQLQLELAERKRVESELKESQQRMADIIDFLPDATFVIGKEGKVIAWNRAMEEMTGLAASEVIGKGNYEYALAIYGERRPVLIDLVLKPEKGIESRYVNLEKKGKILVGEAYLPGNGEVCLFATAGMLCDSKGEIVGAIESIRDISNRKRAEAALQQSEQRFSVFMDNLPACAFIKDESGTILFANRYLRELFGWGEDCVGKTTRDLLPPDLAEAMIQADRRVLTEGPLAVQECVTDVHGAERFFDTFKFPISPGDAPDLLAGIAVDITARERMAQALQESQVKYRAIADTFDGYIYIVSQDYRLEFLNKPMIDRLGFDATGGRCHEVLHGLEEKCPSCLNERVLAGETIKREIKGKDGRWFYAVNTPISHPDGSFSKQAVIFDITDRKQAEEEKEKLEAQLRHSHKMEAVGTLAGGIAHDFNNILAAIIGYVEIALLEMPRLTPGRHYLEQVLSAGLRAKDLVKKVLAFGRMKTSQEQVPVMLGPVITDAIKLLRASLPSTVEIRQTIEVDSDITMADETELHQVLINLCTNASQAMEDRGGVLAVKLDEVEAGAGAGEIPEDLKPGGYLRITVSDTGVGMLPETLERIFDPYFTTKEVGKGSGLGLAVVHGIVKRHNGSITVRSQPGAGSTFMIYLPKVETKTAAAYNTEVSIRGGAERILFVDDERGLADLGQSILDQLGYEVSSTTSSIEALEIFRSCPEDFDLVISDYTMPLMTGDSLAEEMMRIRPNIPIILCTGFTERFTEEEAKRMGIRAFLLKPLKMRELAEVVRKILDGAEN